MTKTTILLIRHGQTDWNLTGRSQGHIDLPLNDTGRRQSERLAGRLAGWPLSAIYCSDLRRASETAAIIGRTLSLEPVFDAAFRERNGGIFQGYTAEELQLLHSEALRAFLDHGRSPPGGESNLELARRAVPALERIAAAHPGQTIALVTHGGTLRVLIAHILGLPVGRRAPFKVSGNTGLTVAEFCGTTRNITLLNDCCHLGNQTSPDDDRSEFGDPPNDAGYTIG